MTLREELDALKARAAMTDNESSTPSVESSCILTDEEYERDLAFVQESVSSMRRLGLQEEAHDRLIAHNTELKKKEAVANAAARLSNDLNDELIAENTALKAEVERLTALLCKAELAVYEEGDELCICSRATDLATMRRLAEMGVCPRCHQRDAELTWVDAQTDEVVGTETCDHEYHTLRGELL